MQGTMWDPEMNRQWSPVPRNTQLSGGGGLKDKTLEKAEDVN